LSEIGDVNLSTYILSQLFNISIELHISTVSYIPAPTNHNISGIHLVPISPLIMV
jgi:hypothetical protein